MINSTKVCYIVTGENLVECDTFWFPPFLFTTVVTSLRVLRLLDPSERRARTKLTCLRIMKSVTYVPRNLPFTFPLDCQN